METSIRIGKDFNVLWFIYKVEDGKRQPYELAGKELVLRYRTPSGKYCDATGWSPEGNVIAWTFRGKDQKVVGSYELILIENAGKDGMVTVDTCKAFRLVAHSCEETEGSDGEVVIRTVTLESEIALAPAGSGGSAQTMTPVLYDELVQLRNDGQLVPATYYRIMDYKTTTVQADTQSAGNLFDVVVLAISKNELSEQAHAVHSERDTEGYFANSNLSAWQVWYCLDNDTTRFAWADTESGKGVIYRMIDEFDNDCPYDFKNIQYKRRINTEDGYPQFSEDAEETWVYTFCATSYHINNDEWSELKDGSLESPYGHMSDEETSTFHHNIMQPWIVTYDDDDIRENGGKAYLNGNVFLGWWEEIGSGNEEEAPFYYAYCCFMNSFSFDCRLNSFSRRCNSNSLGTGCESNSFGRDCNSNSLGTGCESNSFGDGCSDNVFGNYCSGNVFGNQCGSNNFGHSCGSNNFGHSCSSNIFGKGCNSNSFGTNSISNSFGDNCSCNSFGYGCYWNHFVDAGDGNGGMPAHNVGYCRLDDDVRRMTISIEALASEYTYLRYVHIYRGVSRYEVFPYHGVDYEMCYAMNSNGQITQFVLADLAAS